MAKFKGVHYHPPSHANRELFKIIYPVVHGAIRAWKHDHPKVMGAEGAVAGKMTASLLKRLVSSLTAPDVEDRLRVVLNDHK